MEPKFISLTYHSILNSYPVAGVYFITILRIINRNASGYYRSYFLRNKTSKICKDTILTNEINVQFTNYQFTEPITNVDINNSFIMFAKKLNV